MKKFGAILRESRQLRGLKVYELAEKVGVNPVYITRIEKHDKLPSPLVMKKITDALRDPILFETYLKIKYPTVYEQFKKEDLDISRRATKMAYAMAANKNKTPEDMEVYKREMRNMIFNTRELVARYKKVLVKLESIEKKYFKS
jgi:transcriptional regulator with XRE-family HTH domain